MDSPSPPKAPDYAAQAATQGAANLQASIANAVMNRGTEATPYGTRTWNQTGTYTVPGAEGNDPVDVPIFSSNIQYTPEGQALFDLQQRISTNLGGIAESGIDRVGQSFGTPFDTESLPDHSITPDVAGREAVTAALLERMQPQFDRQREMTENDLLVRGHTRGGEAWDAAYDDINRGENDARLAAIMQGGNEQSRLFGLESSARQNALQEQSFLRNLPLNEMNALRTGAQVQNPNFSGTPPVQPYQPGNFAQAGQLQYGADMNAYNANAANYNNTMSGITSLGAAAIPMIFSDRRLKTNVVRIGTHKLGIGLYTWDYVWGEPGVGVMADEVEAVMPEAVVDVCGYKAVNYGMLGG